MDSWQCHWRVLKARAACSLRSPAVARPCPAPTKSQMENGARSSCQGSPSGKLTFSNLRQQVPPAISEVGQVCETETAKTSSDYCCCTVHVDRGDLRELLDIPLDSHSIVLKWACTATTQTSGRAPILTGHRHQADHCYRCKAWQLALAGHNRDAMSNSRSTSQCSHCMASKARSHKQTSRVSCKCANLRQQLPQLDRPADPAHCLPQRTTTAGSLPAEIPAHVRAAQQAHHKAGNVSMCTTAPGSEALECSLTRGNCPWAVPPDSARSGMTSAPSAAVAKHVQLPQYRTTARTGQRVLQANTLLICRNGTSLRCVQHSNLSRVAAVLRAAA